VLLAVRLASENSCRKDTFNSVRCNKRCTQDYNEAHVTTIRTMLSILYRSEFVNNRSHCRPTSKLHDQPSANNNTFNNHSCPHCTR
jgi:hypothetical protein